MFDVLPKAVYLCGFIVLIFVCQNSADVLGKHHYEVQEATGVYDLFHAHAPDFHKYEWITHIVPSVLIAYAFFQPSGTLILRATFFMFLFVLVIRGLTIVSTVLPKHEGCIVQERGVSRFFSGWLLR